MEPERELLVGWHQDETYGDQGNSHLEVDQGDETIHRVPATIPDSHPLKAFDHRMMHLWTVLENRTWQDDSASVPGRAIE